jgi:hypothetical protein
LKLYVPSDSPVLESMLWSIFTAIIAIFVRQKLAFWLKTNGRIIFSCPKSCHLRQNRLFSSPILLGENIFLIITLIPVRTSHDCFAWQKYDTDRKKMCRPSASEFSHFF